VGVLLAWVILIQRLCVIHRCPDCGSEWHCIEYRFAGFCVHESCDELLSMPSRIAHDLGAPCSHANLVTYTVKRYWGLLICWHWSHRGIVSVKPEDCGYTDAMQSWVRVEAIKNPALAEEFRQRVLQDKDLEYLKSLYRRMMADIESGEDGKTGHH